MHNRQSMPESLRCDLALALGNAVRHAVEPLHEGMAWQKTGLTQTRIKFFNQRVARCAYGKLSSMTAEDVAAVRHWETWATEIWDNAVAQTSLSKVIRVSAQKKKAILREACQNLQLVCVTLRLAVANKVEFREVANLSGLPILPVGWDSPALPVPDVAQE